MAQDVLAAWHRLVVSRDMAELDALLDDTVVFHSPIVHRPQEGKMLTALYLRAAMHVLNNESFHYVGEWRAERSAVLEFNLQLEGIFMDGVDMMWWNEAGRITCFKVMVRPLKAINLLHQRMGEMLEALKS